MSSLSSLHKAEKLAQSQGEECRSPNGEGAEEEQSVVLGTPFHPGQVALPLWASGFNRKREAT